MKRLFATAAVAAILAIQPLAAFADCAVFEHRDYGGHYWWLANGERLVGVDSAEGDIGTSTSDGGGYITYYRAGWNDLISSFKVEAGCDIVVYEHINEGGARWETRKSYKYVGDGWNDAISEVQCYCS